MLLWLAMADLTLNELRRYAVLRATSITYRDNAGRVVIITDTGLAQIPGIKGIPEYRVDEVLEAAREFELGGAKPKRITREQMIEMVRQNAPAVQSVAHHEED